MLRGRGTGIGQGPQFTITAAISIQLLGPVWRNGRAFARDPKGRGFESRPVRFQVTALGKLFTRI